LKARLKPTFRVESLTRFQSCLQILDQGGIDNTLAYYRTELITTVKVLLHMSLVAITTISSFGFKWTQLRQEKMKGKYLKTNLEKLVEHGGDASHPGFSLNLNSSVPNMGKE
jgi:hypothetical protein